MKVIFWLFFLFVQVSDANIKDIISKVLQNHQLKEKYQNLRKNDQNLPSIASSSAQVVTLNTYVNQKGYYEIAIYTKINSSGKCQHPVAKFMYAIGVCGVSDTNPSQWVYDTVYADPQGNGYYEYQQTFSDSTCQTATSSNVFTSAEYILICTGNNVFGYTLYHARPQLLDPLYDNLGFTWLTYDSSSDCQANDYQVGALEAIYLRLDFCFPAVNGGGDLKYISCDSTTGLTILNFESTDGTCSGTSTTSYLTSSDTCLDGSESLGFYQGWFNFVCSTSVST